MPNDAYDGDTETAKYLFLLRFSPLALPKVQYLQSFSLDGGNAFPLIQLFLPLIDFERDRSKEALAFERVFIGKSNVNGVFSL